MPENTDPANTSTPPWGDDFDAARAWALVQNLRADLTAEKGKVATVTGERDSAISERDSAITERDTLQTDLQAKSTLEKDLFVERAIRKHPAAEAFADFLTGDTEDEILAKAARLAGASAPAPAEPTDPDAGDAANGDPAPDPVTRPTPSLTPGHGGDTPAPFDADAIVKSVRGSSY
jgi:hypothetical protein